MRVFNHPTIFAKVAAMFGTVRGDHGLDPAIAQCPPTPLRVVAAIGVDNSGRYSAWPRNPRIGEDASISGTQLPNVVGLIPSLSAIRPIADVRPRTYQCGQWPMMCGPT
jgi:hypothetical protein